MTVLELRFLGALEVTHDDIPITRFRSDKVRALLAYLATEADRPHTRATLAALLWPDQGDAAALRNLSLTLLRLREALGDTNAPSALLDITRATIQWRRGAACLDVTNFADLARSADPDDLAHAVELYRGEFLSGFGLPDCESFEEWLLLAREHLQEQALHALHSLAGLYLAQQRWAEASAAARRQLALDPWRDAAHRQLMQALAEAGDRAAALQQFDRFRTLLADQLGVDPDRETLSLHARILAEDLTPPTHSTMVPRHNLPAALTPFIGREAELPVLAALLEQADRRLLTLVGAGGMGKSRLAVEAARAAHNRYADGVFFVALAPLTNPEAIVPAIAGTIQVTLHGSDPTAALLHWIHDKHVLLILDNFEHLLEGVELVVKLLQAAPRVQIIATSRERLNVRGEQVYGVEGLEYGRGAPSVATLSAAMRLFVQSARRGYTDFRLRITELPALRRICELVEGMPLGLELAAAWVGVLSPEEIADEITRDVDFLQARWPDAPERQRSMRAVFDWSRHLLSDTEQRTLLRLSVFRGGFTREAAETITGATLRVLASLQHKSLLHWRPADGATGRYEIHELLRQFAAEQLDTLPDKQGDSMRQQHAAYYLSLANKAAPELAGGPDQIIWFARVAADFDNFRAVLHWALEHKEVAISLRLGTSLREFWMTRGYLGEGRQWLEAALTLADQAFESVSDVLRGSALTTTGWLAANGRDFTAAERLFERSLALARLAEDPRQIIAVLGDLGQAARMQKDLVRAVALYEERVMLSRELGDTRGLAWTLCNLGMIAYTENEPGVGRTLEEGVALAQSIGDQVCVAWCLTFLARVAKDHGDHAQGHAIFAQSLKLFRDLGHADGIAYTLEGCAGLAAARGNFRSAARLFGAAEALREAINRRQPPDRFDLAAADTVVAGTRWQADWVEGRMLSVEQAIVIALAQNEKPSAAGSFPVLNPRVPARATVLSTGRKHRIRR